MSFPTLPTVPTVPGLSPSPDPLKLAADLTEVILPLSMALSRETNSDRLLELVIKEAKKLCHADSACVYLRSGNRLELSALHHNTLHLEEEGSSTAGVIHADPVLLASSDEPASSLVAQVAQSGKSLHVADVRVLQDVEVSVIRAFDKRYGYQTISCLSVPLKDVDESTIAVLQLFNSKSSSGEIVPFSPYQQQVIQWLATQAAAALNNQQLLHQQASFLKGERDLQIGRQIQLDFLPETLPEIPGWEIAAYFHPARDVAGDFYDAFPLPCGRIGLVMADVCDKGVGAALFMSLFRTLIRVLAKQTYSLGLLDQLTSETSTSTLKSQRASDTERLNLPHTGTQALKNAITLTNNYIAETHFRTSMFATMFFGVLNPANGQMIYINAGHEAPLVYGSDGTIRARLGSTGPAVGMMPNTDFQIEQVRLYPGDSLFTYTDGVPEAHSPSGKMFSDERLFELLSHPADSISNTIASVEKAVRAHISTVPQFDDITMLAIRRL